MKKGCTIIGIMISIAASLMSCGPWATVSPSPTVATLAGSAGHMDLPTESGRQRASMIPQVSPRSAATFLSRIPPTIRLGRPLLHQEKLLPSLEALAQAAQPMGLA